ncbi:MAG: sulfatase-like hydrolase/transferase [Candidatus Lokiarchaeota archaeon]|nr:sulfatase-like hydrolase/transferase [Candidatus Lokiarchaeota archaeon]
MSDRMNVIFFITDQQRSDHLSCYGNQVLQTPNIDLIAEKGVRFTNYYCNTPICMPNRASFFTGSYPSVHGTRSNGINLNPREKTIADSLRENGYHTISIGKTHFNFFSHSFKRKVSSLEDITSWMAGDIPKPFPTPYYGFDEVLLTVGHGDVMGGHYFEWLKQQGYQDIEKLKTRFLAINDNFYETELSEDLYPTHYITQKTSEFLERYARDSYDNKPFFLHCSFNDPHHPVCPPGKYKDLYSPSDIDLPANFDDAENLIEHPFLGQHIKDARFRHLLPQKVNRENAKKFTSLTYGSISMIDDGIGLILTKLEELGLAENTMLIFTSDHGDLCADHGLILKGPAHYRGLINIPLLWKIPGKTEKSVSDSLISTVDLPKTILSLLRIREKYHPEQMQGYDFSTVLENPDKQLRDQILIEHDEEISKDKIMRLRTLVTEDFRYTLYESVPEFGDIYNLKDDPSEINNLWDKEELRKNLNAQMLREIIKLYPRYPERAAYN